MELNFDILKRAWERVKIDRAAQLKQAVPGLSDPTPIFVKRVSEDEIYMTVEFRNIETCVPSDQIPLMKETIISWIKKFSSDVQMVRGETPSLIVRIAKSMDLPSSFGSNTNITRAPNQPPKYEQSPTMERGLTNIITRRAA